MAAERPNGGAERPERGRPRRRRQRTVAAAEPLTGGRDAARAEHAGVV